MVVSIGWIKYSIYFIKYILYFNYITYFLDSVEDFAGISWDKKAPIIKEKIRTFDMLP